MLPAPAERSHEVKAVAADGSEQYLTNGKAGGDEWYKVAFKDTSDLASKFLLPSAFEFHNKHPASSNCANGGGSIGGFTAQYVLVK